MTTSDWNRMIREMGSLGGKASTNALTPAQRSARAAKAGKASADSLDAETRSQRARKAVQARWAKKGELGVKHGDAG